MCYHFQFRLQAAGQDGEAVTEILFWDGPEEGIATYKYQQEAEFVSCDCCYVDPIPQVCVWWMFRTDRAITGTIIYRLL